MEQIEEIMHGEWLNVARKKGERKDLLGQS